MAATRGSGAPPIRRFSHARRIRGDLHLHTIWSDGRDTGEAIVRGPQGSDTHIAITDHSERARERHADSIGMKQQRVKCALRERFPDIAILQGTEVDIMPNGKLDFPDEVLAELDIVLASLHDSDGQSGERLLERYIAAMQHPQVHIITHPANRVPGQSEGYDLDYDRLFRVAAETGRRWRSMARRDTSIWTATLHAARSPRAPRSSSTATAILPNASAARCGWASARRAAAAWTATGAEHAVAGRGQGVHRDKRAARSHPAAQPGDAGRWRTIPQRMQPRPAAVCSAAASSWYASPAVALAVRAARAAGSRHGGP